MKNLNWATAESLELTEKLIPDPNALHQKLATFTQVQVAINGAFLHIEIPDPTQTDKSAPVDVYVVPASSVRSLKYQQKKPSGNFVAFA